MTKIEIVTALIAADVSRDYNGTRLGSVREHHIQEALRVAKMIIESTKEN